MPIGNDFIFDLSSFQQETSYFPLLHYYFPRFLNQANKMERDGRQNKYFKGISLSSRDLFFFP
jgi:hypothetical protein